MTNSIEKKHASLQCWLSDWIEKEFPALAEQLEGFVVRGNDSCLCLDNVSLRMADAAMSVLLAYVEATGLPEHRPTTWDQVAQWLIQQGFAASSDRQPQDAAPPALTTSPTCCARRPADD
jgi:hypothetical protein